MNHRDRILAAIQHRPVDRIPTDMWATPEVWRKLFAHLRVDNVLDLYDKMGIDGIMNIDPPYIGPPLLRDGDYWENEWGMGFRPQPYDSGVYDEQVRFPLASATTIEELRVYRWPSADWYDYSAIPKRAPAVGGRATGCGYTALAYYHMNLRGQELSLMDPLLRPEFTRFLLARLSDFFTSYHQRCFEAGQGLIDTTEVTDDFGSQRGLLISPRIFEAFYRGPMQRAIDLAHAHGINVFHHDDGDCRALLPSLTAMGIQIPNPIQWRCGDWDLADLKSRYGERLCFHGAVDNGETLPFGTPEEVRRQVTWLIHTLGADRTGLIVAPCHNLQPITPVENILALYEAVHEYRW